MKKVYLYVLLFVSSIAFAQEHRPEIHCKHFIYGYPYGTPLTNDLIIRDVYALSNNDSTKFADWVAYRLTMHEVDGDLNIERDWKADPWLAEDETLEPNPDDYKRANKRLKTDRGHQAPLGSFKGSVDASYTNYLSNITPQSSALNQGPWVKLETRVRDVVKQGKTVYVMTGPLYEREMPQLPKCDEPHVVPSGYWKIICVEEEGELKVAAFIFDQETPRSDGITSHVVQVSEVEQRSGLDFFWELLDEEEAALETNINTAFISEYFED
jgi:endonuclease G